MELAAVCWLKAEVGSSTAGSDLLGDADVGFSTCLGGIIWSGSSSLPSDKLFHVANDAHPTFPISIL